MTGRRLYELFSDSLADAGPWSKNQEGFQLPRGPLKAWAFLTRSERDVWSRAARRVPVAGRRGPGAKR